MKTLALIILLIFFSAVTTFLGVFVFNIGGIPGVFVAGKPGVRTKRKLVIGIVISCLGQAYLYLSYLAFIVSWTLHKIKIDEPVSALVWFFAFIAALFPIIKMRTSARIEYNDQKLDFVSVQVEALDGTLIIALLFFFLFSFFPSLMSYLWAWVPYVIAKE